MPASGAPTPSQHVSIPTLAGYEETLTRLAAILAKHFADTRIVGTGEGPYRGYRGKGMGWHLWLAFFYEKCGQVGMRHGSRAHAKPLLRHGVSPQTSETR